VGNLKVVGAGPGSPEYITPVAKKTVQNAETVIGAKRALDLFRDYLKGEALPLTAQNLKELLKHAVESAEAGKNVVILSTGDPGFSGLLRSLEKIAEKDVEVDVIPGVSSIQVCAARLRLSWDTSRLFTFHGGANTTEKKELAETVKKGIRVFLLPDNNSFSPPEIANFLIDQGVDRETPVGICENLTLSNERTVTSTLGDVLQQKFDPLCVMTIGTDRRQKDGGNI
jgi:cobalt-precorrin-7 (C5)-methyltransferase